MRNKFFMSIKQPSNGILPKKYANLMKVGEIAPVPPTLLIDQEFFAQYLENYSLINSKIEGILDQIQATSGSFLEKHAFAIHSLAKTMRWKDSGRLAIHTAMYNIKNSSCDKFAVRSAALAEDDSNNSFAGLYLTHLGISSDNTSISEAALDVWCSYFNYAALSERLNAGNLSDGNRMNVMVQPLITSVYAGVAFSSSPQKVGEPVLEYVRGFGEDLVSGKSQPVHVNFNECDKLVDQERNVCQEVFSLLQHLKKSFGFDIDLEWTFDGKQVYILQVRAITTIAKNTYSTMPVLNVFDLFEMDAKNLKNTEPLPAFVDYFKSKRANLFKFAKTQGINTGVARIIFFNVAALENDELKGQLLNEFKSRELIIDISNNIRQIVLKKKNLFGFLKKVSIVPNKIYCVLIRDYNRGEYGLITRTMPDKSVIIEYTTDGLLALNRGSAVTNLAVIPQKKHMAIGPFDVNSVNLLNRVTRNAQESLGHIQLEWVQCKKKLYLVDWSALSDIPASSRSLTNSLVISHGQISGPICKIDDTIELTELSVGPAVSLTDIPNADKMGRTFAGIMNKVKNYSQPPIIVISKPYAALAPLLPHVAGFIFSSSAMLCHLAILLRERSIPAIAGHELYQQLQDGVIYTLDAKP